jgi:ribosomal protein S6--L-glutamate ligase
MINMVEPDRRHPVIIKRLRGSHGVGVQIAESRRSTKTAVDNMNVPFMVQEFAEDPEAENLHSDIRLIVIGGKLLTAMRRVSSDVDEIRSNLSQGAVGEPYEPTQRERELAERSVEAIGLQIGGVDIMRSKRGPLVNEVNVSPEFGIETVTGVNVARAIVELAIANASELIVSPPLLEGPSDEQVAQVDS